MPTPPKPAEVISLEGKSHRTKAELRQRQQAEESLLTGMEIQQWEEVKENKAAAKEFRRIKKLLKAIGKNDALYEASINRYCILQAECKDLEDQKREFGVLIEELRQGFKSATEHMPAEERGELLLEFTKQIAKLTCSKTKIDSALQRKRKMLLDIEKENVMTIASALRSIPKTPEKRTNPLLEALL